MSQREVPDTTHEAGRRCVLQALRGVDDAVLAAMRSLLVLAQSQTGSAVAVMSLLAGDEVHHVLHVGLDDVDSPLARAGCLRAMDQSLLVELPDLLDPGCALSQAQGARWRRYAAGVLTVGELPVGTLAVLCPTPGVLDATARAQLLQLTAQLAALLHQAARQQQLQIQATRLHDLARASGDWLWELDADLRYRWIAGDYAVITGQDPALLLGTVPAPEARVDAQGQALSEGGNLLDLLAQRQPFSRAISLAQTALGPRYVSRSAVPVLTAEGLFAGYRGTARDLTPGIDSARQALRQGAENEALRRDKAQAEHRDQAKSALLSRVSHELRTPMNAVLGFSQLMVNDPLDPLPAAQAARLQGIRTAGGRLLTVIDDLLELVNIGPGSVVCSAGAPGLDLGAALHRQRLAWQTRQGVTGEPFQAVLAQDLSVVAEAPALDRILHHVLNDAFTHGRPGADVQVKARADGDDVVLEVCHETSVSGPLDLGRLFEPFGFTGLSERAARGSGLDLVIARDLARQGGGQLTASQLAGAPLCLALRLPRGAPAHAAAGAGRRASLRQVLYVEDEPLNVVLMEEIFRGRPEWQLHVARTGSDGVALAREVLPDLALIDMNLPDFNGLEVLRRLRADAGTQHIPCVALSADAMVEQIAAARAAGFDDYWTKPIDLLRLLGAVEQVLAGKT